MPDFANKPCRHEHTENEDKMGLYLPFDQLYTGYGWGSSPVRGAKGVEVIRYFYTVTYMDLTGSNVLDVEYVTSGERSETKLWANAYTVKTGKISENPGKVFKGWVNSGSVVKKTVDAGNRNDIVLYESWDNPFVIRFVDSYDNVIYSTTFTKSDQSNISEPKVPEIEGDYYGVWEEYKSKLSNANSDITVRPIYTYSGNLNLVPIDEDGDNMIDYYQVEATAALKDPTYVPGYFSGLPVKKLVKLYKNDGNWDFARVDASQPP